MVTRDRDFLNCEDLVFRRAVNAAFPKIENETLRGGATTNWFHLINCRWSAALFLTLTGLTGLTDCQSNNSWVRAKDFA